MSNAAPRRDKLELRAINVPRASELLAGQLREQILNGGLAAGVWLPSERDLAAQSGLSRGSVRDALRALEQDGLVEIRAGRNGGTIVRRPNTSAVVRSLESFIRGSGIRLQSLLEIRELVEPECAALAAERRTGEQLEALNDIMAQLRAEADDLPAYLQTNVLWHVEIARASQNEILTAFMEAISSEIHAATDIEGFNTEEVVAASLRAHEAVIGAIKDRNSEAARRRMTKHVHAFKSLRKPPERGLSTA